MPQFWHRVGFKVSVKPKTSLRSGTGFVIDPQKVGSSEAAVVYDQVSQICGCSFWKDQRAPVVIPKVQSGTVGLLLKVNSRLHSLIVLWLRTSQFHRTSLILKRGRRSAALTDELSLHLCVYLNIPTSHSSSNILSPFLSLSAAAAALLPPSCLLPFPLHPL